VSVVVALDFSKRSLDLLFFFFLSRAGPTTLDFSKRFVDLIFSSISSQEFMEKGPL
jgi:hypothetical protein